MGFRKSDADALLVQSHRRCCLCHNIIMGKNRLVLTATALLLFSSVAITVYLKNPKTDPPNPTVAGESICRTTYTANTNPEEDTTTDSTNTEATHSNTAYPAAPDATGQPVRADSAGVESQGVDTEEQQGAPENIEDPTTATPNVVPETDPSAGSPPEIAPEPAHCSKEKYEPLGPIVAQIVQINFVIDDRAASIQRYYEEKRACSNNPDWAPLLVGADGHYALVQQCKSSHQQLIDNSEARIRELEASRQGLYQHRNIILTTYPECVDFYNDLVQAVIAEGGRI